MVGWVKILNPGCEGCSDCSLRRDGICPVPGEGSITATVMFVGRDPGETENRLRRPFVGASGKFIREEIQQHFDSSEYYITNLVKCHTVNNIGPLEDQVLTCFKHLENEIIEIMPRVIVALGKTVADYIISNPHYIYNVDIRKKQMSEINGQHFVVDILGREFIVIPTYHPSPRNYDKYEFIRKVISDVSRDYGHTTGKDEMEETEENEEKELGKNSME